MKNAGHQAGGAAAGAGMDYQARVTAWVTVRLLAESDVEPPFGLKGAVIGIACEAPEPVDDLVVRTESGDIAYVQAKRSVSLSKYRDRDGRLGRLAKAVDQFVRQFLRLRGTARDGDTLAEVVGVRFVLAVGTRTPATVRVNLREVLERTRVHLNGLPNGRLGKAGRKALEVVTYHVRASWKAETGHEPSESDIAMLLRLVHVETIEVDEGQRDEREARDILRRSVLQAPNQAAVTWSTLITEGMRLIKARGQADRAMLLGTLTAADVSVRAPRSYRDDIQRLRDHSARVTRRLATHAVIRLGKYEVRIRRPYIPLLKKAVESGPALVIGEPGAGKSGVLHALSETLREQDCEVITLAAEHPPFSSTGGLRNELRLEHDVVDVLANWPGGRPAFLLIDALDAARTARSAAALRDLIREVSERANGWHVVASIREYDARYSADLAGIFKGTPLGGPMRPLAGNSFGKIRHVVVGRLTEDEVRQIGERGAAPLAQLLEATPRKFSELLRTPFNLRLAAELLDGETDPQAIRDVRSQLELLDLYWRERVLRADRPHDVNSRRIVLRKAVEAMVEERTLHVDSDLVEEDVAAGSHISILLSANVLAEWKPRPEEPPRETTLTFAHHVLFDYATARLLLRRAATRVAQRLAEDPAFVLLGRPSLAMHFHHLWGRGPADGEREEFWETALAVCSADDIPEIGRLIGPGVAAELGQTIQEFEPLLRALGSADESVRHSGTNALEHSVRALLTERDPLRQSTGVCCDLAERLSSSLGSGNAYPTSWLLSSLTPHLDELSRTQAAQVGHASRHLLAFAWARSPRDSWLVRTAIRFVARTFATDASASSKLLRQVIEPNHLAQHGHEELRHLAEKVPVIMRHDPAFAGDIYRAAFGYEEASGAPTSLSLGTILPLTSNRHQDYEVGLRKLVESFPAFLCAAPREAVEAMNAALESHVDQEHPVRDEESAVFDFDGERAVILRDQSFVWEQVHRHPGESAVDLLDRVERRLDELVGIGNGAELERLLSYIVRTCRLASVWRRLLRLGARHPDSIGMTIREAGWSLPILMCTDTIKEIGSMLGVLFPYLSGDERAKCERAIHSIPEVAPPEDRDWAERARDQLIGCLPDADLATSESRNRLTELRAAEAVPANDDPVQFSSFMGEYGEKEFLADEGVPVMEASNKRMRELEAPVKEFAQLYQNDVPESRAVVAVLPHLRRLHTALRRSKADGVHDKQADYAWGNLADACAAAASLEGLPLRKRTCAFLRTVLLDASTNRGPMARDDADEDTAKIVWGSMAARVHAATGLIRFLRQASHDDSEVLAAVERLAADPVPAVRLQIATRLHARYTRDADWTWAMIERLALDHNPAVVRHLVRGPLCNLLRQDAERVAKITIRIREASMGLPNRESVVHSCGEILRWLFLWGGDAAASAVISGLADDPVTHLEEVRHLVHGFRNILVAGPVDDPNREIDAARSRSWGFLLQITRKAAAEFGRGMEREIPQDGIGTTRLKDIAHLLDLAGSNVYFASGASDGTESLDAPVLLRFYDEAAPVIDELANVGLASLSHHLLETLAILIPVDPCGVFLRVAQVVSGGRKGGYQYDPMAERAVVRVVHRYLADHRDLFRTDEKMRRGLILILDTFVNAGSEDARRLSYGLDEIFR